jgi:quercetin dioxygenase-like cupin family protein
MGSVHRFVGSENAFDWEDVPENGYAGDDVRGVVKKVLVGPAEGAANYFLRYFSVEPGGYTNLDQHPHDHGVLILHGRATVLLGHRKVSVGPRDVVYVEPNEVHQFRTLGDEPLGFLCVIPAR